MSTFCVEFHPSKEEIFQKSDDECREHAELFRAVGGVYFDADFLPNAKSLGKIITDLGKADFENLNDPWYPPSRFYKNGWSVYDNAWPFHVTQGRLGDCWLVAAIMCLARRKDLLEHILPEKEYTRDCGIVQVRLFVDGKWEVIKIDYHIPQDDGRMRFLRNSTNQLWAALIEKAYAKVLGTYGHLVGGHSNNAFRVFTGSHGRRIPFTKDADPDKMWEDFIRYYSSNSLMAAATPNFEKDSEGEKLYENVGIDNNHAYPMLDFQEIDGGRHRLIQLGCSNSERWKGKWSDLPAYPNDVTHTFTDAERAACEKKMFWIEITDFLQYFHCLYVCEYRLKWAEQCFTQHIHRQPDDETQILKMIVRERQEFVIEVGRRQDDHGKHTLFLNIHKSTGDNKCGELLLTFNEYSDRISTEQFYLDPGTYFVVFYNYPVYDQLEIVILDWVVRSPKPFDTTVSLDFVAFPFSTLIDSVQQVILKYGNVEKREEDTIVIYNWKNAECCLILVENLMKWTHVRVNVNNMSNSESLDYWTLKDKERWWPVPPLSKCIVAYFQNRKVGLPAGHVKIEYQNSSWIFGPFDRKESETIKCELQTVITV
ncbi:hypothetical protein GCK72_015941 [Caenorhabditis remanei]|uniref:Calpain catalytic domain-containing protein n=1 Tax=Caenorhabditis remanei TaxID=31234 RepID=A0A6A5GY11_CAERE|nr:hypothetical protein GCK72_015941 [Caenorhabditis remanei]KAF1759474.1 hypothetical protein GCK72_015941 [Caenorhabditis remanei]